MKKILLFAGFIFALANSYGQRLNWVIDNLPNTVGKTEDLKTDSHNHLYVASTFYNLFDPDGTQQPVAPLAATGAYDSYIGKYNQSGQYLWGFVLGSDGDDFVRAIAVDNNDNVYATGNYYDTLDLNPSTSTNNVYPYPGTFAYQLFVSKYDSSGNFQWGGSINSKQDAYVNDILNSGDGFIYVSGIIKDTTDFDLSNNVFNINQAGFAGFIAKYNLNGQLVWVHLLKGNNGNEYCVVKSMAVDNDYNLFVTGQNGDSVDVDPSANNYFIHAGNMANHVFVASYDSAGSFRWAFSFGGNVTSDIVKSIDVDDAGNCYISGLYYNRVDLDPGPDSLVFNSIGGNQDIFIASYTNNGNLRWGKRMYGNSLEGIGDVKTDANDVYVTGTFAGRLDFDSSQTGFVMDNSASVSQDLFVARYDTSGNYHHAYVIGGNASDGVNELAIGSSQQNFIGGWFRDTVNFELGALNEKRFGGPNGAAFFASYNECNGATINAVDSICVGQTYSFGYLTLDTTGTYIQVLKNVVGCDSVVTLNLTQHPLPLITAYASDSVICDGDPVFVWATGEPNHYWWNSGITDSVPFTPSGSLSYFVEATSAQGCVNYSSVVIDVNPTPPVPQIFSSGDTLFIIVFGSSYQWYVNGNPIANSNDWNISATVAGNYSVTVTNSFGCSSTSPSFFFVPTEVTELNNQSLQITPNPAHDKIFIRANDHAEKKVRLLNLQGVVLNEKIMTYETGFDLTKFAEGIYFLQIENKVMRFAKF